MYLSDEIIENNKNKVLDILNNIEREGFKKSEFIDMLVNSDFFYAPASSKYHNACKGGLCDHCLNVYYNLCNLVKSKHLEEQISKDSIAITALMHDLSKINFYELYDKNVKINGQWVQEKHYRVLDAKDRFIYGNHEETAEYIARQYINLTWEESTAIMTHMAGMSFDSVPDLYSTIFGRNNLATLLHVADTISTYIDEN